MRMRLLNIVVIIFTCHVSDLFSIIKAYRISSYFGNANSIFTRILNTESTIGRVFSKQYRRKNNLEMTAKAFSLTGLTYCDMNECRLPYMDQYSGSEIAFSGQFNKML
jgi:hypothetical protein